MSGTGTIWFPFYVRDFLGDTQDLTMEQLGAYTQLLSVSWISGPLPFDDKRLATFCRMTLSRWVKAVKPVVMAYFYQTNEGYLQKRLEIEREKAQQRAQKSAINGKHGGRPKSLKDLEDDNPTGSLQEPRANPQESSSPSPSKTHKEKEESLPSEALVPALVKPVPKPDAEVVELFASATKDDAAVAVEMWNAAAAKLGLPAVRAMTEKRTAALRAILRKHGLKLWGEMLVKVGESDFLTGLNDRGWRCDLDYACRPDKFLKVLEGAHAHSGRRKMTMASWALADTQEEASEEELEARLRRVNGSMMHA